MSTPHLIVSINTQLEILYDPDIPPEFKRIVVEPLLKDLLQELKHTGEQS